MVWGAWGMCVYIIVISWEAGPGSGGLENSCRHPVLHWEPKAIVMTILIIKSLLM